MDVLKYWEVGKGIWKSEKMVSFKMKYFGWAKLWLVSLDPDYVPIWNCPWAYFQLSFFNILQTAMRAMERTCGLVFSGYFDTGARSTMEM